MRTDRGNRRLPSVKTSSAGSTARCSQQFSSPIEEIGFARVQFRSALILFNGFQRITQSLVNFAEQVMRLGFFLVEIYPAPVSRARTFVRARS